MPTDFDPNEFVLVGRIGRPHGLAGAVAVELFTDAPEQRFGAGAALHLDDGTVVTVVRFQRTERAPLVTFDGVMDRTGAEGLRGQSLYVPLTERRPLEEGEFWPDELEGMDVVSPSGEPIGTAGGIEVGQGQDRLIVRIDGREVAVPFVADIVPEIDLHHRRIVVDLPDGLID